MCHFHEERKAEKMQRTHLDIRYKTEFSVSVLLKVVHFICNNFLSLKSTTFTSYSDLTHNADLIWERYKEIHQLLVEIPKKVLEIVMK